MSEIKRYELPVMGRKGAVWGIRVSDNVISLYDDVWQQLITVIIL